MFGSTSLPLTYGLSDNQDISLNPLQSFPLLGSRSLSQQQLLPSLPPSHTLNPSLLRHQSTFNGYYRPFGSQSFAAPPVPSSALSLPPRPAATRLLAQSNVGTTTGKSEMKILNNHTSNIVEAKRQRTANRSTDAKLESQQSEDSTLRHSSQASSDSWQPLILKELERTARLEVKLDDVVRIQQETMNRLGELQKLIQDQQTSVSLLSKQIAEAEEERYRKVKEPDVALPKCSTKPVVTKLVKRSSPAIAQDPYSAEPAEEQPSLITVKYESDEEDILFSWPVSAEDMFNNARKAREARKARRAQTMQSIMSEEYPRVENNLQEVDFRVTRSMSRRMTQYPNLPIKQRQSVTQLPAKKSKNGLQGAKGRAKTLQEDECPAYLEEDDDEELVCHEECVFNGKHYIPAESGLVEELEKTVDYLSNDYSVPKSTFAGLKLGRYSYPGEKDTFERYTTAKGDHFVSRKCTKRAFKHLN